MGDGVPLLFGERMIGMDHSFDKLEKDFTPRTRSYGASLYHSGSHRH
ncbi:hypothetical protein [Candidatus Villigracilis saccharophilus]|nr:hypothetical protein [Anaerolineales bacterium]